MGAAGLWSAESRHITTIIITVTITIIIIITTITIFITIFITIVIIIIIVFQDPCLTKFGREVRASGR